MQVPVSGSPKKFAHRHQDDGKGVGETCDDRVSNLITRCQLLNDDRSMVEQIAMTPCGERPRLDAPMAEAFPSRRGRERHRGFDQGIGAARANMLLKFADTGFGMTQQILSRIFEPSSPPTTVGKGDLLRGFVDSVWHVRQHHGWVEDERNPTKARSFGLLLFSCRPSKSDRVESVTDVPMRNVAKKSSSPRMRECSRVVQVSEVAWLYGAGAASGGMR